jgi:hypothetical protein
MTCIDNSMRQHDVVPPRSAVWCYNGAANLLTIKIESLYMLWSQYKLVTMRCSDFLQKQITRIPNFANWNSNFLTFQTSEFKKKSDLNLSNQKRNRNSVYNGGPRNRNQKLEFPTKVQDFKEKSGQKTRKITQEHFPKLLQVKQLIKIFENKHNDIRVTKVWFLKKKNNGDGFTKFHHDYKDIEGGRHDVSFTVVINVGKLNDANEIATINISQSNKEPSVLTGSRMEEMTQKLAQQEREEINQIPKEDLHLLQLQMMNTKDINNYMDYLQEQDEIMCKKVHGRKPSLLYKIGFIQFDTKNNPQCRTTIPRCARGGKHLQH